MSEEEENGGNGDRNRAEDATENVVDQGVGAADVESADNQAADDEASRQMETIAGLSPEGHGQFGPILDPVVLRYAVLTYLVVLPIGHFFAVPVFGATATLSDFFLGIILLAGFAELDRMIPHYAAQRKAEVPLLPAHRTFHMVALLFVAFSGWVALGGVWGFHTGYAVAKGVAYMALGLGALAIVWCGAEWNKVADAWLLGTAICLVVTWAVALVPSPLQEQVLYRGGSIRGLPVPRLSGPFPHPTMFGDYLVVSGALLWARWRPIRQDWGIWATVGVWLLAVTLFFTVSSAWIGAGVLLAVTGLLSMRQRHGRVSLHRKRLGPVFFVIAGVAVFTMTFMGVLLPMGFDVGGLSISASGIRPSIWSSAWQAVVESPMAGVGASPYLAQAADPLSVSSSLELWDAHNLYLSLLGQFGLVGFGLIFGAVTVLVRAGGSVRRRRSRRHGGERGLQARLGPVGHGRAGRSTRMGSGALVEGGRGGARQ